MSVQVRARREAATFLASYVGAQGELLVDTTNNRVQVHDGATPGGAPAAKLSEVVTNTRTAVADAAYTALATDRTIAVTTLTGARTITLPAASAYPTGTQLLVFDESGACSASNAITIARAGTDTINGGTAAAITSAYGYLAFESNGIGRWTVVHQTTAAASAGTARTPVADVSYTVLTTDRLIGYTSLTAARTATLPSAAAFPVGTRLLVLDESGAASATNTITLARAGSDTINGGTSTTISAAYGYVAIQSNGASKWTITDQPGTSGTSTASRTAVADTNYTALASDRLIAYTTLTAARTVTLPGAGAYPTGVQLFVVDETGTCSATSTITIARAGSDTINGATSASIATAYGYLALETNGAGKWTVVDQAPAASGGVAALRGYLSGLTLANNGTNPTTQIDTAAGIATSDDNTISINLASTLTKSITSTWVAGSGNGGLDTGAVAASTWYHVFLISNASGSTTDVLVSMSVASPTLPSGFAKKRRIGSIRANASSQITAFVQTGDRFDWAVPVNDYNATPGVTTAVTVTLTDVPAGIPTQALLGFRGYDPSNTSSIGYVSSLSQSDVATGANALTFQTGAAGSIITANVTVVASASQQIRIRSGVTTLGWLINVLGWIDTRGK